jgi:signal transduction histidine kinase
MQEQSVPQSSTPERRTSRGDRREGTPPYAALDTLVRLIEYDLPAMRGSVLLLDDDGATLRHGAAPSLPAEYTRAIDGSAIGPVAGSCGTAAWRREQVIVGDIAIDPLWAAYRDFALPFGLRACWSTPILDEHGVVLGTFAMYYREPRVPTEHEQGMMRAAAMLGCNILVRAQAEESLRISESKMRAARAEAEHANKVKSDFLAMMSHELRTPLNAIGGYARLMLDGIPNAPSDGQANYLGRIVKAQQHLLSLIESVLTHAKLDAGRMTYRLENIRVGELLDVVESLSRPQLAEKGISYDCAGCDSKIVLRGDRQKLVQILLNLMSNAIKFTPAGGHVEMRTSIPAPGRVVIGVRDTGIGMTAEQVATVFEPFVQFDNRLTREAKGTGLGMPISRELARGMGGDLTAESEPGVGTEFLLTLSTDVVAARAD